MNLYNNFYLSVVLFLCVSTDFIKSDDLSKSKNKLTEDIPKPIVEEESKDVTHSKDTPSNVLQKDISGNKAGTNLNDNLNDGSLNKIKSDSSQPIKDTSSEQTKSDTNSEKIKSDSHIKTRTDSSGKVWRVIDSNSPTKVLKGKYYKDLQKRLVDGLVDELMKETNTKEKKSGQCTTRWRSKRFCKRTNCRRT